MLQWMGGSRRKVATSRKSTYKRQKQYFEQRKQQTTAAAAGDGKQQSRSLDILSLLNVPTTTLNDTPSPSPSLLYENNDNDDGDFSFNHHNSDTLPAINAYEQEEPCRRNSMFPPKEYPTTNCLENEYSNNVSAGLRDRNETLDTRENKLDDMKMLTAHEISVMYLLGESGPNNETEDTSMHEPEAHVAFSVKGLGKVEITTPVHSPKRPVRYLSNGSSSKIQAMGKIFPSQLLNNGLDDSGSPEDVMLEDVHRLSHDKIIEPFFSSRDIMSLAGANTCFNTRKSTPFNWTDCELTGAGDELFSDIHDNDLWNGHTLLEDNTEYIGEHKSFNKRTLMDQREFGGDDYLDSEEQWMDDFTFGSWNLQNKRTSRSSPKKTRIFCMTEKFFPYTKHQVPGEFPDLKVTRTSGDVKDTVSRFVDDTRGSLSLASEESSSSTAGYFINS